MVRCRFVLACVIGRNLRANPSGVALAVMLSTKFPQWTFLLSVASNHGLPLGCHRSGWNKSPLHFDTCLSAKAPDRRFRVFSCHYTATYLMCIFYSGDDGKNRRAYRGGTPHELVTRTDTTNSSTSTLNRLDVS